MHKEVRLNRILPLVAIAAVLAAVAPRQAGPGYEYKKGATWEYETLFAPFDFPILKTPAQMQAEMDKASDTYVPYFKYSGKAVAASLEGLRAMELGASEEAAEASLKAVFERGVVSDDEMPGSYDVLYIQKDKRAVKVPAAEVYDISTARARFLSDLVDAGVPSPESLAALVVPNLEFDAQTSDAVNAEAFRRISPTAGYISAGQLIVSKGEVVTAEIEQILDSYTKEYETNVGGGGPAYLVIAGNVMVAVMLVVMLLLVILFSGRSFIANISYYYLIFVFAIFSSLIMVLCGFRQDWLFMAPLTLAALYLQAFVRARVIVPIYMITLLPLLVYAEQGPVLFIIFLAGGLVSIYASRYLVQRWKQFLLALFNFAAMALTYLALWLTGAVHGLIWQDLLRLLVASALAVAGYPLIYLFEKIFNLVSNSRLAELADTSSPLLRELERKAPGTFQHSLQVMNMADAAARAIDVNPLLLRVGALYHDIGKINDPICFIENESLLNKTVNGKYHASLTPRESAEHIIKHVSDGIEMARRRRLPGVVVDFIRTHHGTTVTGYFWSKYLSDGGDASQRAAFSYPGPEPSTKEQIILMLCDSIEAASRTLTEYSPEAFSKFVESIVQGKMDQGQFRNADISIKELNEVKQAIKNYLAQMHHGRVAYPAPAAPVPPPKKKFLNFK